MTLYLWERWIMTKLSDLFVRPAETAGSNADDHHDPEEIMNRIRINDARLDVLETRTEALERAQRRKPHPV